MDKNIIKDNKIWLIIFVLSAFILFGISTCTYRSLFFDAPAVFFQLLIQENFDGNFFIFIHQRTRLFSDFLFDLPYNALVHFLPNIPMVKINLFHISYLVVTFFAMALNFLIAYRTKMFKIAAVSLAYYALLYLPNSVWYIKECHLAILLSFALLQYFLTSEKLTKFDYLLVTLLLLYSFESYEQQALTGLVIFSAMLIIIRKPTENKRLKTVIGISGFLSTLYVISKTVYGFVSTTADITFDNALYEYTLAIKSTLGLFNGALFISIVAFAVIIAAYFYKKKINVPFYLFIVATIIAMVWYLNYAVSFVPCPRLELQNYIVGLILFFPIILLLIGEKIFNKNILNKEFCSKLIVISCIFGILGILWQINSCKYSYQYAQSILNKIHSKEYILTFTEDEMNSDWFEYHKSFGTLHRSVLLSDYQPQNLLISQETPYDEMNMLGTYYDEKRGLLYIQNLELPVVTKYFDLSKIIPAIEYCATLQEKQKNNTGN